MEKSEIQSAIKESIEEQLEDAINITHLLTAELTSNEEDVHIIRSVGVIAKILNAALENLKQLD